MRIAALGDLHIREAVPEPLRRAFAEVNDRADVLVLCGDLTDHGFIKEADVLAEALGVCRIPKIAVLGNHDYESTPPEELVKVLTRTGLMVFATEPWTLDGVGFVGAKGFAGGFGRLALQPWGEHAVKQFVQDAVNEGVILERALHRLKTEQGIERTVAVLHYAPIRETVQGEPLEVFPFLGSSRLVDPLDRFGVAAILHAHAHHGSPEGRTPQGIPVYNVSLPVLRQVNPEQDYRLIEV
ncbi:MAG TPA: metallophosphoesterase [bacterium]|nr:metallophosphoesterase [bacterium]